MIDGEDSAENRTLQPRSCSNNGREFAPGLPCHPKQRHSTAQSLACTESALPVRTKVTGRTRGAGIPARTLPSNRVCPVCVRRMCVLRVLQDSEHQQHHLKLT